MNRAMLIGRLTKEPELRATTSGISVCTFTLAVERRFKQEGQQQADFIPIVVWRGQADSCAKYLHKGSQAAVCGSVQTRSYDAPDGSKRYVTEIVADEVQFLGKSDSGDNDGAARMVSTPFREEMQPAEEDDLPF